MIQQLRQLTRRPQTNASEIFDWKDGNSFLTFTNFVLPTSLVRSRLFLDTFSVALQRGELGKRKNSTMERDILLFFATTGLLYQAMMPNWIPSKLHLYGWSGDNVPNLQFWRAKLAMGGVDFGLIIQDHLTGDKQGRCRTATRL
jgi:hypothetical protein